MLNPLVWTLLEVALVQTQESVSAGLLREADQMFGARKYAEALATYRTCSEQAAKDGNRSAQVESLAQVARCTSIEGKLDEGRPWLERAEKLASADEPLGWSRCLGVRGIFQRESGDKGKAKATFEEMHRYCVEKKLFKRALDAIHHIAIVVPAEEQPAWALKGIAAAEQLKDDASLAVLWNNLGASYEDLKQYEKMVDAYLKAREFHHKTGGPLQKMIADWAVGHGYRLAGKLGEAETWLRKALPQAEGFQAKEPRPDHAEWVGWCKKDLGEVLLARGQKAAALDLLKAARAALLEAGMDKHWPEGFKAVDDAIEKAR
jgi:tetratricopeptide (TPR) repeat protein